MSVTVSKSKYFLLNCTHLFPWKRSTFSFLQNFLFLFSFKRHQMFRWFFLATCRHERHRVAGGWRHRVKINSVRKMADLRKVCPESLPCHVNYLRKSSLQGKLFIFLCIIIVDCGGATTHWVVTEDGKIQQQVWWLTLFKSLTSEVASL